MCVGCLFIVFLEALIDVGAGALTLAVFLRAAMSWFPSFWLPFGLSAFAWNVGEFIVSPIRRVSRNFISVDFSPFIALLIIDSITFLVLRLLPHPV